jgi:Ca2+-transporting ATPase
MSATEKAPLAGTGAGYGTLSGEHPGLTSAQAAELLARLGPNKLDAAEKESFFSILVVQCKNVIFLLTTIAATICFLTKEETKATVLLCIVFFVCITNALGEYSGQDAGEALASLSAKNAQVLRDGKEVEIPAEELVEGDVVKISIGDKVPADMILLEGEDVSVDQGLLTGESVEARKTVEPVDPEKEKDLVYKTNILYKDTLLVEGAGKGEVIATGMRTQVGNIAKRLDKESPKLNPLQNSINRWRSHWLRLCCDAHSRLLAILFLKVSESYEPLRRR